jgi:hypothetical protein
MLVVDDEPQSCVKAFLPTQAGCRRADTLVEHLPFVVRECAKQVGLGRKPAVQRRSRDTSLRSDIGHAQLGLTIACQNLGGGLQQPIL